MPHARAELDRDPPAVTQAALSDWPASALLQPLPCPVTPVLDETLHSYLRRLADANGMRHPGRIPAH